MFFQITCDLLLSLSRRRLDEGLEVLECANYVSLVLININSEEFMELESECDGVIVFYHPLPLCIKEIVCMHAVGPFVIVFVDNSIMNNHRLVNREIKNINIKKIYSPY